MTATPHDALFKAAFSQVVYAAEELRHALPSALVASMDFSTLAVEAGSFVDEALRERHTDLLYSLRVDGRDARIYVLFEHQSTADVWMLSALQQTRSAREVRRLLLMLILQYILEVRGADELPIIDATVREIATNNRDIMQTIAQMLESRGRQQGHQQGHQQGLQQGREQGLQQGQRELLLRLLRRRFGELPAEVGSRVAKAAEPELERWAKQLLAAACLDDVFA